MIIVTKCHSTKVQTQGECKLNCFILELRYGFADVEYDLYLVNSRALFNRSHQIKCEVPHGKNCEHTWL